MAMTETQLDRTTSGFWRNRTVAVTGAGGFIGSQLTEELARQRAKVRAFVRYSSRGDPGLLRLLPKELASTVELLPGDLRDPQAVRDAVRDCEVVFHLGAIISIPYSYRHPAEVAETNFIGTLNVLMACRDLRVGRLIHASSSEVYGTAQRVPMDESHPLRAQSPYSASKIGADKLAESFYCAYDLPVVTVRPFNTFGPRQSARAVIPTVITQALVGGSIRIGNIDARRDFTFVSDTVAGFLSAAQAEGVFGQTFNLGTGQEVRIGDLVQLVAGKVGHPMNLVVEQERLRPQGSEVERLCSDNTLARKQLGWEPRVPFEEGIDRTIEWIGAHLEHYRPGQYEF